MMRVAAVKVICLPFLWAELLPVPFLHCCSHLSHRLRDRLLLTSRAPRLLQLKFVGYEDVFNASGRDIHSYLWLSRFCLRPILSWQSVYWALLRWWMNALLEIAHEILMNSPAGAGALTWHHIYVPSMHGKLNANWSSGREYDVQIHFFLWENTICTTRILHVFPLCFRPNVMFSMLKG